MPISRTEQSLQSRQVAGFTLLELVIVMVLLGLTTTLAVPSMQRWYDALQARSEASAIVETLQVAAFDAGVQKRSLLLDEQSFAPAPAAPARKRTTPIVERVQVNLPPGWQVGRSKAALFGADGLCQPGLVALNSSRGTPLLFVVKGPICRIEWMQDHGAG